MQVSFDMLDLDQNLTLEIFKLLLVEYLLVDCPKLSQKVISSEIRNIFKDVSSKRKLFRQSYYKVLYFAKF